MLFKRNFRTALFGSCQLKTAWLAFACFLVSLSNVSAQQTPSIFGAPEPALQPATEVLPPEGSPTLLKQVELRFPTQGNVGGVDYDTYLYYMEIKDHISLPSQGKWVIFNLEERERVKIVSYVGSDELKVEDINLNLQEQGISMRLDSFVDPGTIRRVKFLLSNMFAAKGYAFAEINHTIEPVAGGPKLISLTFEMDEGPKVQVHTIDFLGNSDMADSTLKRK